MPLTEKELLNFVVANSGDAQTCFQAIAEFAQHNDAKILMHFFKQCHNIKLNAMEIAYQTIGALLGNTGEG